MESVISSQDEGSETESQQGQASDPSENALLQVQQALDRLDYRSAIELASQAIDSTDQSSSQCSDQTADILYLRSLAHERSQQYSLAVQDAEDAARLKEKDSTFHIRVALSHLASSLRSVTLAQEHFKVEDKSRTGSSLSNDILESAGDQISKLLELERKRPFRRVTPEIFLNINRYFDFPSLAMSTGVSRSWKESILGSPELFSLFKMKGTFSKIQKGLQALAKFNTSAVESIELEFVQVISSTDQKKLSDLLSHFRPTIQVFQITHLGDFHLTKYILNRIGRCPKLRVLKSINRRRPGCKAGNAFSWPAYLEEVRLESLVWHQGHVGDAESLEISGKRFRFLKHLELHSWKLTSKNLVQTLSNCSTLQTVDVPYLASSDDDDTFELKTDIILPELETLKVTQSPRELGVDDHSSSFFRLLDAPKLRTLEISNLCPSDLVSFRSLASLSFLKFESILTGNSEVLGERVAAELLRLVAKAEALQTLNLNLCPDQTTYRFWEYMVSSFTPLSTQNIRRATGGDCFILPKLSSLELGSNPEISPKSLSTEIPLDQEISNGLVCLVRARRAMAAGHSQASIFLAANQFWDDTKEETESLDLVSDCFNSLSSLKIKIRIFSDPAINRLIEGYVGECELGGLVDRDVDNEKS